MQKMQIKHGKNIVYSSLIVTIATFSIKALGMLKQAVIASFCGATLETDAFFVATGILGQLAVVVFSAISITSLSIYSSEKVNNGTDSANQLINSTLYVFLPISILFSVVFYVFARPISLFLAPSYDAAQLSLLVHYVHIMSIAFIPWCYYLSVNVVLESNHIFLPGKGQGFFQNIFVIFAAVILFKQYGMDALVYAFLLSGIAASVLVTFCARKYYHPRLNGGRVQTIINQLLPLAIPLILGNAIYEINDIVDKLISISLGYGMASILTYGAALNEIVTGIIVAPVATVLFANFTTWAANNESEKIANSVKLSIEYLTVLIVPVLVMCIVAGDQIVTILYGRGSFGQSEINATYLVVVGYALGFIFQSIRAILARVFYAYKDTTTPMVNGIISVVINITMSIILSKILGVMGIAIATSIGIAVVTALLLLRVRKYLPGFRMRESISEFLKALLAGGIIVAPVYAIKMAMGTKVLLAFIIEGFICVGGIFVILLLLRSRCILRLLKIVVDKLKVKG